MGEHAHPPPLPRNRQPHRRRRGGRAAGQRHQGTGRERPGRGRAQYRDPGRRRGPVAHPDRRRRQGHPERRTAPGHRAPRHIQAGTRRRRRRGPVAHPHPGLQGRGPALHRLGRPPVDHHPVA
ncbi:hypothetical protein BBAL3_1435 [Brevundimonas sp. BAL3]|nr:hypothetical protein BBAL3_1435 [Brevundimonas sp. BAL3]